MEKQKFTIADQAIKLDDRAKMYLTKKVYTLSGNKLGTVKDILFANGKITSLLIKGRNENIIDFKHIKPEINDRIMLSIDPISLLLGKTVFDKEGKKLGKVKSINQIDNKNEFTEMTVKRNIFTRSQIIKAAEIETLKENIILNTEY